MDPPSTAFRAWGYPWSLPNTLFGVLVALIGIPTSVRWSEGCIEVVPLWIPFSPMAQSHGCLILYKSKALRDAKFLRVHERVHVVQSFYGGAFYALAYLCNFLVWFAFAPEQDPDRPRPRWKRAYYKVWFEQQAYAIHHAYARGERPGAWGSA